MKILYIITGLGLGGAEKVVIDLADQMVSHGHSVKIAYLTGDILVHPKSDKIEIIYLGLTSGKKFLQASKKYRKLIKLYQPDVVHAHMVHANIFARLNRIGCSTPKLICTAHNSNEGGKARMLAYKYTNFLSDFNSNVSEEATQSLINKGAFNSNNLTTVYNGVDLVKFNISPKDIDLVSTDHINCLSVGRFNEQKDYPNLLNAIALIVKTHKNISFKIAGDGVLRPQIESLINKLKINEYVELLGNRSDIPSLLKNTNFFILSSRHEGLPTVLIEAMACGSFIIATDCGGSKEIMDNTGILVAKEDSEALAEGVIQALSLTEEQISTNNSLARTRIEEIFSLTSYVKNWIKIYESK